MNFQEWKKEKLEQFIKSSVWRKSFNEDKRKHFYYNKLTKVSQWTIPDEIANYEKSLLIDFNSINSEGNPILSHVTDNEVLNESESSTAPKKRKLDIQSSDKVDSIVVENIPVVLSEEEQRMILENEKNRIEGMLKQKDAILEPNVCESVKSIIISHKEPPANVIKSLVGSYVGYPQMCLIALEWVKLANHLKAPESTELTSDASSEALIVEMVAKFIKKRFNRKVADELVLRFRSTPDWLREFLGDEVFRQVLVDLHERNPGSSFLGLCMKEIHAMDKAPTVE